MIFDNRDIILKFNKRRYLLVLLYVTFMAVIFFSGLFEEKQKLKLAVAISVLYVIYNVISLIKNYNYFSFREDQDYFMFRFVSMSPFDSKKRAIKINKNDFAGFDFKESLLGSRKNLILSIQTKNGVANYPPISISALSQKHKNMLKQSLSQFV